VVRKGVGNVTVLFRNAPASPERRNFMGVPGAISPRTGLQSYHYDSIEALRISAVVACVGLRAGAFAQLPLKGYRNDANGQPQVMSLQPSLYADPSDRVTASIWRTQMSISRDLWGFALGRIIAFDAAMYPTKVDWIDPSAVKPKIENGDIVWLGKGGRVIDSADLLHVPSRWVLPGNPTGISPLAYSGLTDLARKAQDFGRDWFTNGAVPSSIVYSDAPLDSAAAEGIVETILNRWTQRRPAVLGSGLRYEKISVPANESQFLETCNKVAADIAISFNLPPSKIGAAISGQSVTYSNRDQDRQEYLVDSINPDLVVIQEALDRHTPKDQYCKFSTGAFMRSDTLTRYQAHKVGIESGFLTPNEARALEEMPPLLGGDSIRTDVAAGRTLSPAEALQKIYLAVGSVISADEARRIVDDMSGTKLASVPTPTLVAQPTAVNASPVEPTLRDTHVDIPIAVTVRQEPMTVHVPPPVVEFQAPPPVSMRRRVERDEAGRILAVIDEVEN
jgi:HK97 family phage portal protein